MDQPLKAYQIGANDIVAAYSPEGALAVLIELAGDLDPLTLIDVVAIEDAELDSPVVDEDDSPCPTIRQMLAELCAPAYLFGWE